MTAETKRKGQVAELAVMAAAVERGYRVAIPYGEDAPYDLVVERHGRPERVQCKYVASDGRVVQVRCRSTNNWLTARDTPAQIEWIATYDVTTQRCYFVPAAMLGDGRAILHLGLEPPINGHVQGVRWAADFLDW